MNRPTDEEINEPKKKGIQVGKKKFLTNKEMKKSQISFFEEVKTLPQNQEGMK